LVLHGLPVRRAVRLALVPVLCTLGPELLGIGLL